MTTEIITRQNFIEAEDLLHDILEHHEMYGISTAADLAVATRYTLSELLRPNEENLIEIMRNTKHFTKKAAQRIMLLLPLVGRGLFTRDEAVGVLIRLGAMDEGLSDAGRYVALRQALEFLERHGRIMLHGVVAKTHWFGRPDLDLSSCAETMQRALKERKEQIEAKQLAKRGGMKIVSLDSDSMLEETLVISLLSQGAMPKKTLFDLARIEGYKKDSKASKETLGVYFGTLLTSMRDKGLIVFLHGQRWGLAGSE